MRERKRKTERERDRERERERESSSGIKSVQRLKRKNVLFCGDLLWIISVTRIKRLIGGFNFDWFLIAILKCISFCNQRAKEFKVFCEYIYSVLDREVRGSKYSTLVEATLHLAVKLQLDLIIRAIL